ncbi:hypothetical protein BDV95DRAFT_485478 [Massariosphaeria phaeospora]|uniref:Uncharacterized protein n=1 Tax=Massariosphaeria phaeospora TaxID=100035 RepID=A0A7C8IG13_9PLEO|nr:hypothetical protein BDV95DRAFT_485478 [Massariosphaeria phaeospora]
MPSSKDRLYVALYARGGAPTMPGKEDTYHWALLVGPKDEVENGVGMRYHAKERITGPNTSAWLFEERETTLSATSMLLVRVMIAKVEKKDRLLAAIRNTPVRQGVAEWNCVAWVQEALRNLEVDGRALGTGVTEWTKVRNAAMEYCQRKKDGHRFDGQGDYDMKKVPTYDLVEGKEKMP